MTPAARRGSRLARLLPAGAVGARRTPFVLLVVVLLGSGLISLLLLNSSLNQGSFELSRLQRKTTELTDEQQALQQDVDRLAAPDALERRARDLGMIPGGSPAFLNPDGTVSGVPAPAGSDPSADAASYVAPAEPPRAPDAAPAAAPAPAGRRPPWPPRRPLRRPPPSRPCPSPGGRRAPGPRGPRRHPRSGAPVPALPRSPRPGTPNRSGR
ncbi:septum formation initiator family protein [Streptomyces triculaminicus]|uniref:Septum formation initiator family protein n=2 Tax=Streptomyces TaxID=1883 RepID=A0A939FR37_9ACTN|nr:septum formation initiator family protein [Streptomyces triculaminicus]MBO0656600.1 septum formation initiator family protein [Streptomyces triculaminicus]